MRKSAILLLAAITVAVAMPAFAELQTVQVGGQLRIRGNWYSGTFASRGDFGGVAAAVTPTGFAGLRWPAAFLPFRPVQSLFGGNAIQSLYRWDNQGNDVKFIEQRTKLNVRADFTNDVSAFIELDSYDVWGGDADFRSNYITGFDARAASVNDVEVYQAYIEARNMWQMPLTARIGRQELNFGSGWLVGTNDNGSLFTGLSFDAFRLTYGTDQFSVDAFAAKLFENGVVEEDGDIDFYGIYGSYKGMEGMAFDAYWLWLRDARRLNDTNFPWFVEWLENWLSVDDYDVTNIHTIGLRGAGTIGAFDFDAEFAYQFGKAGQVGFLAKPFVYGDDGAKYSNYAGHAEVGYTFDMAYNPRVFLGGAYIGGEDNREITFAQWLNPFDRPKASVSFNRLFSNVEYSKFLDNTELSNVWLLNGGVSGNATETISVKAMVTYLASLESFDSPAYFKIGSWRVPIAPNWPWWTSKNSKDMGWETDLSATYKYTEDLSFEVGWAHLFTGGGLKDGNFNNGNGLAFNGGVGSKDGDLLYFETKISF